MAEIPPKIKIGAFEVAFLADGLWRNDGGCMFGVSRVNSGNTTIRPTIATVSAST